MASYAYGNTTGTANSKFRVVLEYTASNLGNGYYQYKYRYYVQVTAGNFYGTSLTRSWGSNVTINGTGKYGYSGYATKNVAYGANFTLGSTLYAQYTGSKTYRSEISGTKVITTVPKPTYSVKYNANGGTGAPGQQTKTYGTTLKLSTTKPTRTGYTFQGWATSASGSVAYAAGANYTANAAVTLYAVWKANTYTVKFDANGGTGAPGQQTKTYGVNLTLSSTKPTRTNYNFLGWGTSAASTTVAYAPGATYSNNSAITLYAIWELAYVEPSINNLDVIRCTSTGAADETGTYAKVTFDWSCNQTIGVNNVSSIKIEWGTSSVTPSASGISGSVSQIIGGGAFSTDLSYEIKVTVTDSTGGFDDDTFTLPTTKFLMDFKAGGKGIAIGKAAQEDLFDVALPTKFRQPVAFERTEETDMPETVSGVFEVYNSVPETDTYYAAERTDTGIRVQFGVGQGGYNHGIWSDLLDAWMINSDKSGNVGVHAEGYLLFNAPAQGIINRKYGENVVLWSGSYYMYGSQTANLSQAISAQPHGVIIVFSKYANSEAYNEQLSCHFVPKYFVSAYNARGCSFNLNNHWANGVKYLYISDTKITGQDLNRDTRTVGGISYTNTNFVLRNVIGV